MQVVFLLLLTVSNVNVLVLDVHTWLKCPQPYLSSKLYLLVLASLFHRITIHSLFFLSPCTFLQPFAYDEHFYSIIYILFLPYLRIFHIYWLRNIFIWNVFFSMHESFLSLRLLFNVNTSRHSFLF